MANLSSVHSQLIEMGHQYYMPNYNPRNIVFAEGFGSRLHDIDGNEFIDLSSGIGVNCLGHQNPEIVAAITKQAKKLWHTSNIYFSEPPIQLARELVEHTFAEKVFFCNSGAEANEAAIKLARKFASENYPQNKRTILTFEGSFHGRTMATMTATAQPKYQSGFEPLPGGFRYCPVNNTDRLRELFDEEICAVLIEPIQGEGGVVPAEPKFLQEARRLCDEFDAILIYDEVQSGMGRTGKLLAYEWVDNAEPDVATIAKALGAGMPIGATLAGSRLADVFSFGSHGSTYGGNPVCCAVARVVLEKITKKSFQSEVVKKGEYMFERLNGINNQYHIFKEIRGRGMMVGAQFLGDRNIAADVNEACLEAKVLILQAGPNVLRFLPAMTIEINELALAFDRVENVLKKFA